MRVQFNPVIVLAAVLGLTSLALPWLQFRPNRLLQGEALGFADITGPFAYLSLLAWLLILGSAALSRWQTTVLGMGLGAAWLVMQLGIAATTQASLAEASNLARVSFSSSIWLALFALYVGIYALSKTWRWAFVLMLGLILLGAVLGRYDLLGPAAEFRNVQSIFAQQSLRHFALAITSLLLAALLALPLGYLAATRPWLETPILGGAGLLQTIPSIALFGLLLPPLAWLGRSFNLGEVLMLLLILAVISLLGKLRRLHLLSYVGFIGLSLTLIPLLGIWLVAALSADGRTLTNWLSLDSRLADLGLRGIGAAPVLIALTLYAILPIVVNTFVGLRSIAEGIRDAALGMGMNSRQLFWQVELPLALPFVIEGLRAALVLTFGITTVAALVGAGGLGFFILRGVENAAPDLVLIGALPIVVLALTLDALMRALGWLMTPQGLRK